MQNFMEILLICSISMSAAAVLYMAAMPLLARRYSEKGRYYAWLIIIIGLIIPFRPQFSNALVVLEAPIIITQPITVIPAQAGTPHLIFTLWLAGLLAFIAFHTIKHHRFAKMARRWSEEISLPLFDGIKAEMGIKRHIPLYICPCVGSPTLIGLFKPRILLPTANLAQDELGFILRHELVHFKRKDLWYKHLVLAATALHWFNPIVHLLARAINALCETSCDAEVLQNADADTRLSYSEAIIGVVKFQSRFKTALTTNFYGGKKSMKNRISSIMDNKKKKAGAIVVALVMTVAMGAGLVLAADSAEPFAEMPVEITCSEQIQKLAEQGLLPEPMDMSNVPVVRVYPGELEGLEEYVFAQEIMVVVVNTFDDMTTVFRLMPDNR
jgi:beta-lactamase regulating signal transducer with metallopeptidase domain